MRKETLSLVSCPNCAGNEFTLEAYEYNKQEISEGALTCSSCAILYRIENGILDLLPLTMRRDDLYGRFAFKHKLNLANGDKTNNMSWSQNSQIDFFKKTFNDYEKNVVNNSYYMALELLTFVEFIDKNQKPGWLALDLGCGTGRQCLTLAKKGIRTIGIDISEEMLLLAKRKIDDQFPDHCVNFIVGDATNPPLKDESFDVCSICSTLHHLPDKAGSISKAVKKLKMNGLFYSIDPNNSPLRFIFDFMMKIWKLYDEEASDAPLLSEEQLTYALKKAGIKNKIKYSTYLPPHLFYLMNVSINTKILKISDYLLSRIPYINRCAGVIISEGVKSE